MVKMITLLANAAIVGTLALTLANPHPAHGQTFSTDHYLGYRILRDRSDLLSRPFQAVKRPVIFLEDQFDEGAERRFRVGEVAALYNPAIKNDEVGSLDDLLNPDQHLVGYELFETVGRHEPQSVAVENQFGNFTLETIKPDRLLVPSAKGLDGPTEPLADEKVDHFKCYQVKAEMTPTVFAEDQFGRKQYKLAGTSRLCNPVKKIRRNRGKDEVTEIKNSADHLLCFLAGPVTGKPVPLPDIVEGISTNNQFGPLRMVAFEADELCVPSSKEER